MSTRVAPNLFVAGSPKCGTSSVHAWLAQLPQVAEGRFKELRYVLDRGNPLLRAVNYHTDGLGGWLSYYAAEDIADAPLLLDSTPEYQRQATALEVIGALEPKPQVILVFRKPSERLFSLYRFAKYTQNVLEADETFASFVAEVERGGARYAGHPMLVNAFSETDYAAILADWQRAVGADRVFALLLEDLEADPKREMAKLVTWLGLPVAALEQIQFAVANKSVKVRFPALRRLVATVVQRVPAVRRLSGLRRLYRRATLKPLADDEYSGSAAARAAIDARFADMIARLGEQMDLSRWQPTRA